MNIFCFGLSHQIAPVEIRERFVVPNAALPDSLRRLTRVSGVDEGVILSTCNRTEFYVVSQTSKLAAESLLQDLYPECRSADLGQLARFSAIQAARHLFRVVSGLESMVVGETEIFGQVKRAYETAMRNGTTGKFLNRLFQKSFEVGKQVRSTTGITRGSVSLGSVAVDLAEQIFGNLKGSKVMVLGAGETSEKTARAFQSRSAHQIFVSNRSFERAQALAMAMGGRAIRFDDWANEFRDLDILVSSTSAPHALVTVEKLGPILRGRRDRPLFIIDLAIPRDVDPEVHRLDGVYVYDLDSLRLLADRTLEARKFEAERCENLIEKYVTDFQAWLNRTETQRFHPSRWNSRERDDDLFGTRGSQLALAQTELVKQALERIPDHPEVAIAVIKTQGDQRMDLKLSESGETFDKGLFTKELEEALLRGEVDVAVHALKDLPTELPSGLELIAVLPRHESC